MLRHELPERLAATASHRPIRFISSPRISAMFTATRRPRVRSPDGGLFRHEFTGIFIEAYFRCIDIARRHIIISSSMAAPRVRDWLHFAIDAETMRHFDLFINTYAESTMALHHYRASMRDAVMKRHDHRPYFCGHDGHLSTASIRGRLRQAVIDKPPRILPISPRLSLHCHSSFTTCRHLRCSIAVEQYYLRR